MRWTILVVVLSLSALETRAVLSARAELARAEAAKSEAAQVIHLRRAARWRAPLSPYPDLALERLRGLARTTKDRELALSAWEGIRGALLGSRILGSSSTDLLQQANEHIAALRAGASEGDRYERLLAGLEVVRGPDTWWSVVALVGLSAWIAGGAFVGGRSRWRMGLVVGGLVLFVAGLTLA